MKNEEVFAKYVGNFDFYDPKIKQKIDHSFRVKDLCEEIAKKENFTAKEIEIAKVIGLLHDIGRFEQWKQYKTYNDLTSVDHGDSAIELLFNNGFIKEFNIDKEYHDIVYDSIKYHNKKELPGLGERKLRFAKLVRDADKLDILYIYSTNDVNITEDLEIRENLTEQFKNKENLTYDNKLNETEFLLLMLSFIFDINYQYTFKYLKENEFVDKMDERIKNKEKFGIYFRIIKEYINERLEEYAE